MHIFQKLKLTSWLALPVVVAAAIAVSAALSGVHAQNQYDQDSPEAATLTSYAEFQYATLTGTTNTINATMVPVVTPTGTAYKDLTFQVTVSSTGAIAIVSGSPTVVASPTTQSAGFKAGTYNGPNFGSGSVYTGMQVVVSGPGVVPGGFTDWSLSGSSGGTSHYPYPASATWYVGSPTSPNNPLAARLKKVGITSTAYSYGTASYSSDAPNSFWGQGTLIGVSQTGNAITISSFSIGGGPSNGGSDSSAPVDQITFTLK
ncbi:MAG: hypothetical protein WCE75_11405 [Terracidiphilus sp.]